MYCDGYTVETKWTIEAKATVTRESSRMAIGQVFDFAKLEEDYAGLTEPGSGRPTRLIVLVPQEPSSDLVDLALSLGTDCVYPISADRWTHREAQEE